MEPLAPIRQAVVIPISDPSQVSVARRAALEAGRRLALDEETLARAEIVSVELARNILAHAAQPIARPGSLAIATRRVSRPGELLVSSTSCATAIQIVAIDDGAGIPNISRALADGFTTADTPGTGLGAVQRLSRHLDLFSIPVSRDLSGVPQSTLHGTVASAVIGPPASHPAEAHTAVLSTPLPGESVNGDSWATRRSAQADLILLVDGLGHGQYAHEAASLAVELFHRFTEPGTPARPLAAILRLMHPLMRSTRGAAIALASIDPRTRTILFCGVGNISAVLTAPGGLTRSLISHSGTLGYQMQRVQEFSYSYTPETLLIMHSDGITTSWKLAGYPGLEQHSPATIAGVLYRDAWRGRDDATILVTRLA